MDLLLIGGGPRSVIQASSDMVFMLLYNEHFQDLQKLGAHYDIKTTIIEKQPHVGAGMAFSAGHEGMTNTPVEGDITFPIPVAHQTSEKDTIKALLSYRERYERRFGGAESGQYLLTLNQRNLPGAVMFKKSLGPMSYTPQGMLDQEKAFLMRRSVGEEELASFSRISQLATEHLPFFKLDVRPSTLATQISLNGTHQATATVKQVASGAISQITADVVRLNSGTPLVNPISDPSVNRSTFCQPMNSADLRQFLRGKGLLNANGILIPGTRIISGGMSLSGLDQIAALSSIMNLFEEDEDSLLGYRVTDFAKQAYPGALTYISRTAGKAALPRHAFTHNWQQGTPVIGNTRNLHALFLHQNGEEVFKAWYDILECAVARATGTTPEKLGEPTSTESLLKKQFEETEWHLQCRRNAGICEQNGDMVGKKHFLKLSTRTLYGAWRQATLSTLLGFGLEPESDAVHTMDALAPLTWTGRQGYMYHRAQIAAITNPKSAAKSSNMHLVQRLGDVMNNIVASPSEVHSMFHLLIEAGIAKYVQASYSAIQAGADGQLMLNDEAYDAVLVSGVMTKDADVTWKSLLPQVKPAEESNGTIPAIGRHRRFSNKDGSPVAVESNTFLGKGFHSKAADGGQSLLNSCAFDVNNRDSAVNDAPSFTMRRMALAHLHAAGLDAHSVLDGIYESMKPSQEDYDAEVERFREPYESGIEMWAYLKAITRFSKGNAAVFADLYDLGITANGRRTVMKMMGESRNLDMEKAASDYLHRVTSAAQYSPASREEFYGRFVDATEKENGNAYEMALEIARNHLENSRVGKRVDALLEN